jgi:hypothetical protein
VSLVLVTQDMLVASKPEEGAGFEPWVFKISHGQNIF